MLKTRECCGGQARNQELTAISPIPHTFENSENIDWLTTHINTHTYTERSAYIANPGFAKFMGKFPEMGLKETSLQAKGGKWSKSS